MRKVGKRVKKEASIRIRITPEQKRLLEKAARAAGQDLSNWLRGLALREVRELGLTN